MRIIKFDYFVRPHVINKQLTALYYPIISIELSGNHRIYHQPIKCFVDSGSDFNLMPAEIGDYVGLDIVKGEKIMHMGIGNVPITTYGHKVKIYMSGYKFETNVHFSYEHKIPLLGRFGFFNHFKRVTFNEQRLQLELVY